MIEIRAVAITAISQYHIIDEPTAEECKKRSNRDICVFYFFVRLCLLVLHFVHVY